MPSSCRLAGMENVAGFGGAIIVPGTFVDFQVHVIQIDTTF